MTPTLRRTTFLLLFVVLIASSASPQGRLKGCVSDANGGTCPGVGIVASSGTSQERHVTDVSGCYEFVNLPVGTYSVTASLAGFLTSRREGVVVTDGPAVSVDFELCPSGTVESDWPVPGGLKEMFQMADAVAYVRIRDTRPVTADCPNSGFLHTVEVIELLKHRGTQPGPPTLVFVQERWLKEQTPYRTGQAMVVFLSARKDRYSRAFGPSGVFFLDGDKVTSVTSHVRTDGMSASAFLAQLRALAKGTSASATSR